MLTDQEILFIEPSAATSAQLVIDVLTRKMTAALRKGVPGTRYRGFHTCACGAMSSNCIYTLPGGELTNSLAIHYLACHRDEVSSAQLQRVAALDCGEAEPTQGEIQRPDTFSRPRR